jgi:hypothetical protein
MTDGTLPDGTLQRAPRVGDIVMYRPREQERALRNNSAQEVAAIVTRADSADTVNLRAFADGQETVWVTSVGRGNGVGQWRERECVRSMNRS